MSRIPLMVFLNGTNRRPSVQYLLISIFIPPQKVHWLFYKECTNSSYREFSAILMTLSEVNWNSTTTLPDSGWRSTNSIGRTKTSNLGFRTTFPIVDIPVVGGI